MNIQSCRIDDIPRVEAFIMQMFPAVRHAFPTLTDQQFLSAMIAWRNAHRDPCRGIFLVCDQGRIVGSLFASTADDPSPGWFATWRVTRTLGLTHGLKLWAILVKSSSYQIERHEVYLSGIAVLPEYRRDGIGQQLIETAINYSHQLEKHVITCLILSTNAPSRSLVTTMGFKLRNSIRSTLLRLRPYKPRLLLYEKRIHTLG